LAAAFGSLTLLLDSNEAIVDAIFCTSAIAGQRVKHEESQKKDRIGPSKAPSLHNW